MSRGRWVHVDKTRSSIEELPVCPPPPHTHNTMGSPRKEGVVGVDLYSRILEPTTPSLTPLQPPLLQSLAEPASATSRTNPTVLAPERLGATRMARPKSPDPPPMSPDVVWGGWSPAKRH